MSFKLTPNVRVERDEQGTVRRIHHPAQAFVPADSPTLAARSFTRSPLQARELADEYVRQVLGVYGLDDSMAENLTARSADGMRDEGPQLRFEQEKEIRDQAQVSYRQTCLGLPVWRSGMSVKLAAHPYRVVGSVSSVDPGIAAEAPPPDAAYLPDRLDAATVARLLGLDEGDNEPAINGATLLVYPFDPEDRGNGIGDPGVADETQMHVPGPTLDPPELSGDIESGRYYVVTELLFTLETPGWDGVNWRALVEPVTGGVLRLDSFIGCVDGHVYLRDPLTRTGNTAIRPTSPTPTLDALRDEVEIPGLEAPASPAGHQALRGEFVELREVVAPAIAAPTEPPGDDFSYSVPTDDFAAVNAYYHCDRLFRILEGMGFDIPTYFDGTVFPVRVDHRVSYNIGGGVITANTVNASAPGNARGDGSDGFRFALLERNTNVGIALHWRVTLHEFGHTILWDHVDSPNFPFAHSAGDSLAAILNDPDSQAPDRFLTFPWSPIARRHDRRVEDGWGWGGRMDNPFFDRAGYDREQILSSTLFRFYRAIGGDHTDLDVDRSAARYTALLIFSAIGGLSPVAPPLTGQAFCDDLIEADQTVTAFESLPGGTTHKVMRWAFERQGAFQPPGAPRPTIRAGAPPAVDVYIEDGRGGGYDPQPAFVFSSDEIWNRTAADTGLAHQDPVAGQENFLFVRVHNRGSSEARNVAVEVFSTTDGGARSFPDAWQALDTPAASAAVPISAGGNAVVGPFRWTPANEGPLAVLASAAADGDPSNASSLPGSIAAARLAHCDNNIAGRMMRVAAGVPVDPTQPSVTAVSVEAQPRLPIPDADPFGVVSRLEVAATGLLARISVSVTILHTYIGDLLVTLHSPSGSTVVLHEGRGIGQSEDDLIATFTSDSLPDLASLHGEPIAGSWSLRVVDRLGFDVGSLERWGMELTLE